MLMMLFHFVAIYAILHFIGIGFARKLVSENLQAAIAPLIGYCIISVFVVYFLAFEWDRHYLVYGCLLVMFFSCCFELTFYFKNSYRIKFFPYLPAILMLLVSAILKNYSHQKMYHSVNTDIVGYLASADCLNDFNYYLSSLSDFRIPYAYEMLHTAKRWGFPGTLSLLSKLIHQPTYALIFPLVIIVLFSGAWTTVISFNNHYKKFTPFLCQITITFICLNPCILYLIYEAFYPNIIGLCLLSVVMTLLIQRHFGKKELILGSLFAATLIATYSEVFSLLGLVVAGYIVIDILITRKFFDRDHLLEIAMLFSGVLLVFPLSFKLIHFVGNNINNLNNLGYPQPAFLLPSDFLGFTNIYSDYTDYTYITIHAIGRSIISMFWTMVVSIWVMYEVGKQYKENLLLVLLIGCCGIYLFNIFIVNYGPVNYIYDKIVMLFSMIFICYFFMSLDNYKIKIALSMSCLCLSLSFFLADSNLVFRGSFNMPALVSVGEKFKNQPVALLTNERGMRSGIMIPQLRYVDFVHDYFLDAYTEGKLLDQFDPYFCHPFGDRFNKDTPIYLVIKKASFFNIASIITKYKKDILYENKFYLVINTHTKIGDIFIPAEKYAPEKLFVKTEPQP